MLARRTVLKSAAGLPLAAILADPLVTRAVAQTLDTVELTTLSGATISAALAIPEETPAGAVLMIHEWWGLNDQIRAVAAELAMMGYVALAVDLFGGHVADTPEQARMLTGELDADLATETLETWIDWLDNHAAVNGRVATMGWCFGGGWSLRASLARSVAGTVIYYGRVPDDPAALEPLAGPVLGHFANQDAFITPAMVDGFEAALAAAGKTHTIHRYDADHAFANPTSARYDEANAARSWERTSAFLAEVLGEQAE